MWSGGGLAHSARVSHEGAEAKHGRFTSRLEAFSDLVFGFSLSLLATRLDVPARVEDIFDPTRWLAVIGTFGLVCRFWLEHYRIFRHEFVAEMFDAIVNFVFLFAIAILPYTVQTFLRFSLSIPSFTLYLGDFSLILATLATLRVRSLRQRRGAADRDERLRDWRRAITQLAFALFFCLLLFAVYRHGGNLRSAPRHLDIYIAVAFCLTLLSIRIGLRRLPAFLA